MGHDLRLDSLSDAALLERLGAAVQDDNELTAVLLRYIDEVDRRCLWQRCGHSSLFVFLVRRFHMSEAVAYRRIRAARACKTFPLIVDMVARGELHLTAVHILAAHLTAENHRAVLTEAKHKTQKELEQLVARLAPQPDLPSRIRKLPTARSDEQHVVDPGPLFAKSVASAPLQAPRAPDPKPLSPGRYALRMTMSEETHQKLERVSGLLAHDIPDRDPAKIVDRALDALLEKTLKRKAAATDAPRERARPPSAGSRHVPAQVRRAVWDRDGGKCAFVGEDGRRCNETRFVELAHLEPWARGGAHTIDNIALRCRAHNAYEAVRDYGPLFMARKIEEARGTRETVAVYRARCATMCRLVVRPLGEPDIKGCLKTRLPWLRSDRRGVVRVTTSAATEARLRGHSWSGTSVCVRRYPSPVMDARSGIATPSRDQPLAAPRKHSKCLAYERL